MNYTKLIKSLLRQQEYELAQALLYKIKREGVEIYLPEINAFIDKEAAK